MSIFCIDFYSVFFVVIKVMLILEGSVIKLGLEFSLFEFVKMWVL